MSGLYGIEFTQFLIGGLPRITDIVVGTRDNNNYQFNAQGVADTNGNPIVLFAEAGATALNINQITITNAVTGTAPTIAPSGTDTSINLGISGFGPNGVVHFTGTTNIIIPAGTAGEAIPSQAGGLRANTTSQYLDYWSTVSNSWVDLTTGSAASNLTYVTNTDETAFAPNSQPLEALATGIMKVTTATGIVSSLAIPLTPVNGGSGVASPTAHGVLIAEGASAFTPIVLGAGQILIGTTSSDPVAAAIGSGAGILVANGSGAITISNTGVTGIAGTANEITASASTGSVTLSIPSTFIAPGTVVATTSVSSPEYLLTGSGSGTISILPQAAAGTYNFNLPITAGTSGYVLTSAGGAGSAMTWTNPASIGGVNSVSGTTNRITASPTTGAVVVDIAATYVGQSSITTVGALASGSLAAGFIPVTVPLGGTGNTTFTAYSVICAGTTATGTFQNVSGVGTSGQVLTSNGASALPTWQAAGGTGSLKNVQYFTSGTGTYTKTSGANEIIVIAVGGGGGGGGVAALSGQLGSGGGGGAGGFSQKFISSPSATYAYAIGAAGAAPSAGNNPGGNGGNTTFGSTILTAAGGTGGGGSAANSVVSGGAAGGAGGTATGGDIDITGGTGSQGLGASGISSSGGGASSMYGAGGPIIAATGGSFAGTAATGYGAGGGGAAGNGSGSAVAGGAGSGGLIIVYEFA